VKKIMVLIMCLVMMAAINMPTFAAYQTIQHEVTKEVATPRAEVTQWMYRIYNGVHQKRLWSITYGYWKTEWMPV